MAMFRRSRLHRFRRLILVSLALGAVVAAVLLALPWFDALITPRMLRNAALAVLIALEVTYVGASVALCCGAAICGVLLWLAHRTRATGGHPRADCCCASLPRSPSDWPSWWSGWVKLGPRLPVNLLTWRHYRRRPNCPPGAG